jgi:hypothetical protein
MLFNVTQLTLGFLRRFKKPALNFIQAAGFRMVQCISVVHTEIVIVYCR